MIRIKTDDGITLDQADSLLYINWMIKKLFDTIYEFKACIEIKHPSFWGEYELIGSEEEYKNWISVIADRHFANENKELKPWRNIS